MTERATITLVAALVIPNILAATGRADATYSATLQASLTVSGFLDGDRNPISKPAGLTLASQVFFIPYSFTEGESTAFADGALDVVDPVTLSFDVGYDYAVSASVDNPELEYSVAIAGYVVFTDLKLYAPEPEEGALEGWFFVKGLLRVLYPIAEYNDSHAETGAASFEVTLSAGKTGTISISSFAGGDPPAVPEPTTWMLGAMGAAMLSRAVRRRRMSDR